MARAPHPETMVPTWSKRVKKCRNHTSQQPIQLRWIVLRTWDRFAKSDCWKLADCTEDPLLEFTWYLQDHQRFNPPKIGMVSMAFIFSPAILMPFSVQPSCHPCSTRRIFYSSPTNRPVHIGVAMGDLPGGRQKHKKTPLLHGKYPSHGGWTNGKLCELMCIYIYCLQQIQFRIISKKTWNPKNLIPSLHFVGQRQVGWIKRSSWPRLHRTSKGACQSRWSGW